MVPSLTEGGEGVAITHIEIRNEALNAGKGTAGGGKGAAADVLHSALYGAINGIVAVPAMVSFVAITFQVCSEHLIWSHPAAWSPLTQECTQPGCTQEVHLQSQ